MNKKIKTNLYLKKVSLILLLVNSLFQIKNCKDWYIIISIKLVIILLIEFFFLVFIDYL